MQFNRDCNDTHTLLDLRKWRVPIRVHFQINWGSGRLLEYNRRWLSLITTIRGTRFHSRMMMTLTEPHIVCWSWACLYSPLPFNSFIFFLSTAAIEATFAIGMWMGQHMGRRILLLPSQSRPRTRTIPIACPARAIWHKRRTCLQSTVLTSSSFSSRDPREVVCSFVCFSLHLQVSDLQVEAGSRIQPPPSGLHLCLHCPPSQVTTLEWISLILITLLFILICTCSRWDCKRHAWRSAWQWVARTRNYNKEWPSARVEFKNYLFGIN